MKYLADGKQMKAIDAYTIDKIGIPPLVLMERAALCVAGQVKKTANQRDSILAVCGVGNNGGDGIAAARILKEAGCAVTVLLVGDEDKASEQTKRQLTIARNLELPVLAGGDCLNKVVWNEYTIIIDALFGIGLTRGVTGIYEKAIIKMNESAAKIYAVDVPSGVSSDTGQVLHAAVKADVTVTFGLVKTGLVLYPGAAFAGRVTAVDIGFPKKALEAVNPETFTYDSSDKKRLPVRDPYSNKGTFGKVLAIAGSKNMAGAAYFAAKSACYSGAGLVKLLTAEENRVILQSRLPEALFSSYTEGELAEEDLEKEMQWADSIVIGPGLSMSRTAEKIAAWFLKNRKIPAVVDADALNLLARQEGLAPLASGPPLIITPHLKEMSRLARCEVSDITKDIRGFAVETAKKINGVLVLKDARTVVTDGTGVYINTNGNSGMATGGSGDVLAGLIAGLLAQGMEPMEAACLGVYLHGRAGDSCLLNNSEYTMTAGDIVMGLKKEIDR